MPPPLAKATAARASAGIGRLRRRDLIRKKRKIERGRGQYRDVTQKDVSTAKHCIEAYQQALRALNTRINVLQGETRERGRYCAQRGAVWAGICAQGHGLDLRPCCVRVQGSGRACWRQWAR